MKYYAAVFSAVLLPSLAAAGTAEDHPQYSTGCVPQRSVIQGPGTENSNAGGAVLVNSSAVTNKSTVSEPLATSPQAASPKEPEVPGPSFRTLDDLAGLPRPQLGARPYGPVTTSCTVPGTLALTFDDGPWRYTSQLLEVLERRRVRATFFVCGGSMAPDQITGDDRPRVLRRMLQAGHQVAAHTWAHPHLAGLGRAETARQMLLTEQALARVLGVLPTYFRPPFVEWDEPETPAVVAALGYRFVTFDLDTEDWRGDYAAARRNFLARLGRGPPDSRLVLAHDIHERTVSELAEWMIDTAEERGYRLVTVGECLGDPETNWYRDPYSGGAWRTDDDDDDDDDMTGANALGPALGPGPGPGPGPNSAPQNTRRQMYPFLGRAGAGLSESAGAAIDSLRAHACMGGLFSVLAVFYLFL